MQRYFVTPEAVQDGTATITGDDVKHIVRVMRMEPGEEIIVCDSIGHAYLAELSELGDQMVRATILQTIEQQVEAAVKITLAQGLPKGDKMELIVQKGTEVGISRFIPIEMSRCIVQYDDKKEQKRRERWQKIAKEAAEQSHRTLIPAVANTMKLKQLLESSEFDLVVVPYEGEKIKGLREVLAAHENVRHVCVLIGPEGGIAPEEIELAVQAGAIPVTLGPRILRTETAGLVAATCIYYQYGEIGG